MFLVGIFQWWYGAGLGKHMRSSYTAILRTADFFSVTLLAKTLFAPFRQISAASVQGPLPVQLHAFFDKLFSRCIGAVFRTMMILIGLVAILVRTFVSGLSIFFWAILPLTPIIGAGLWLMGVDL